MAKKLSLEGYKDGRPDASWWLYQIEAGAEWRNLVTNRNMWDIYHNYYNQEFGTLDPDEVIFTRNLFFMIKRTMIPRTYFRNPNLSVTANKPGPDNRALAKVMEQVYRSLVYRMDYKKHIKRLVGSAFNTSTGVLKLGFGAEYALGLSVDGTAPPLAKDGSRVEYKSGIVQNMPWVQSINLGDFVLPVGCTDIGSAFFQAHRIKRYRNDVERDERYNKKVKFPARRDTFGSIEPILDITNPLQPREMVTLWEIRDRRTRSIIVIAPEAEDEKILYFGKDDLQTDYSSPFYLYTPNPNDDFDLVYGVADAKILYPLQEEMNMITQKIHEHIKLSIVKILADANAIDEQQAEKLLSDTVGAVIRVAEQGRVLPMAVAQVPESLFRAQDDLMQHAKELMTTSRNQFGEFAGARTTGKEVDVVERANNLRVEERRDMLSDITVNVFRDIQPIIFKYWNKEQVIKVSGDQGYGIWVRYSGKMLEDGDYEVKLDPDTGIPETADVKFQRAKEVYGLFKDNTEVDRIKLTKIVVDSIPGVTYDNILRGDLNAPETAYTPEQAGQIMQQVNSLVGGQNG